MKKNEVIGGLILFLFGGLTTILSLQMPIGSFRAAGTGLFPLCLGIILMGLSALFLLRIWMGEKKEASPAAEETPGSLRQVFFFLGTMALATLAFSPLGFPLTSFLTVALLLKILGEKRWIKAIGISALATAASYFLFVSWLKIPLPKGWIGL